MNNRYPKIIRNSTGVDIQNINFLKIFGNIKYIIFNY